jgi:hypothetical protein
MKEKEYFRIKDLSNSIGVCDEKEDNLGGLSCIGLVPT